MKLAPDIDTMSAVIVTDLREGDQLVNVGTVEGKVARLGVWVIVEVITSKPALGTGLVHINQHENLIFHESDTVVVVQADD